MKVYYLRILPGEGSTWTEHIEANNMSQNDGAYIFYDSEGKQICYYPSRATIIEKIVTI
jgi:hypothetical protein